MEKMKKYNTGIPNMDPSTLNIIIKGIFRKINIPKDSMINFC